VIPGRGRTRAIIPRLVLVLGVAMVSACGDGGSSAAGSDATSVKFAGSDGTEVSLAQMKGTPVVVNMWATWCRPCVTEMPAFDEVASNIDGVRIIGVNVADTPEAAAKFAGDLGVSYEQFTDPDGNLSTALSVSNLPATAFVDADGKVVDVHSGAYTAAELRDAIDQHFPSPDGGTTP
jgi:thiol-disulfide isomerase/thioredoxin